MAPLPPYTVLLSAVLTMKAPLYDPNLPNDMSYLQQRSYYASRREHLLTSWSVKGVEKEVPFDVDGAITQPDATFHYRKSFWPMVLIPRRLTYRS